MTLGEVPQKDNRDEAYQKREKHAARLRATEEQGRRARLAREAEERRQRVEAHQAEEARKARLRALKAPLEAEKKRLNDLASENSKWKVWVFLGSIIGAFFTTGATLFGLLLLFIPPLQPKERERRNQLEAQIADLEREIWSKK